MAHQPREYGSRQLHQTLDYLAETTPERLYATIAKTSDISDGFLDITCRDMSLCTNTLANWIEVPFGRSQSFETLCYMGIPDLASVAVFFAAVKCGYKVLFLSPRNTAATNASLLKQTQCTIVIHAQEVAPIVHLMDAHISGLKKVQCISFQDMLAADPVSFTYEHLPWAKAKKNPIVVLHSSGSTGHPRPITMTHGSFGVVDGDRNIPQVPGRKRCDFSMWDFPGGGKFYHVFPYFHLAGFLSNIVCPTFSDAASPVLGPALQPPSGDLLKTIMESQQLKALYIPPSIAEQVIKEAESMDLFRDLDFVSYAGAPFSTQVGNKLVQVTNLISLYGTTEALGVAQLVPPTEAWDYMEWNPNIKHEMQPCDDDAGTYELVLYSDPDNDSMSAISHNMPGVMQWRTKDLFKPHPTLPGLWKYDGRRDDIIVLSNGEKFNPVPFELSVQSHPSVSGALVVGVGRPRASLLLERAEHHGRDDDSLQKAALVDSIWPLVQDANKLVPGHGRLARSNILVVDKPFTRAGKGTIVRKLTTKALEPEINSLYVQNTAVEPCIRSNASDQPQTPNALVRSTLAAFFPLAHNMRHDDDLFSFGLDSLGTVELVNGIKAKLHGVSPAQELTWLGPTTVYRHPTIARLSEAIEQFLNTGMPPAAEAKNQRNNNVERLCKKYTAGLPRVAWVSESLLTVAITGSTGSLGTALTACLLRVPGVKRVLCLNRDPDAAARQMKSLVKLGVTNVETVKLNFMTIQLEQPNLGLRQEDLANLLQNADILIHNAWRLDFNLSLESFEIPYIRSVRSVIDLSIASHKRMRLFFVSSISSVMRSGQFISETTPLTGSQALELGYAESKCVAEMLLADANRIAQVPAGILRLGQLAGSTNPTDPVWPTHEWLYPVMKASQETGLIPTTHFQINWIPINLAADAIAEIVTSASVSDLGTVQVYNLVNPKPIPWDVLVAEMQSCFGPESRLVPLQDWIDAVSSHTQADYGNNSLLPAALKFMREMHTVFQHLVFATDKARAASLMMENMEGISRHLIARWIAQWGFS